MQPILSVVIPTKNRYKYLTFIVEALLESKSEDFELIIQDNSEDNAEFQPFINATIDTRFHYNHYPTWLSVCDNCDMGISQARGEYVCMIGDDDGILVDQSVAFLKEMKKNNVDAVVVNKASYVWPDVIHSVWGNALTGKLDTGNSSSLITKINIESELNLVLKKGAGYSMENLPRVYHGFIAKKTMDNLKARTGSYFPGPSPDMANAIGLTKYIKNALLVDFPFVISGHGAKSTGGQGQRKEHHGLIESQTFLPKDTVEKWGYKVPFFWSGHTIYAESVRRALVSIGEQNKAENSVNYAYLYASCFVYEKHPHKVFEAIRSNRNFLDISVVWTKISFYSGVIVFNRGINFLKNIQKTKRKHSIVVNTHKDIKEVITTLNILTFKQV